MNKSSKKNKFTRREALQILGAGTGSAAFTNSALQVLVSSVVSGLYSEGLAETMGVKPRKHLFIQMAGAPPRWTSDLFMTPFSSTGFSPNKMVGTAYVASGGRYVDTQYKTVNINGVNCPWQWQFNVPRAGGGNRPMAELLNNMLAIRGYSCGDNQHEPAQAKLFLPIGASTSLMAMAADNSGTPIPALNISTEQYVFRSKTPIAPVSLVNGGNMLATLLDPFINKAGATFNSKRSALSEYLTRSLASLQAYAVQQHPSAGAIFESQKGADELLRGAIGDMTVIWNTLFTKYKDIVTRALSTSDVIPGISDLPIGITGTRDNRYRIYDPHIVTAPDMQNAFTGTIIVDLAEHFAVAEYVLLNNISGSVAICPGSIFNVSTSSGKADVDFDEHFCGDMVSLYANALYNRALHGCMLELIDKLKAAGLFNNTVIDVRGEFGRWGQSSGFGSEHAEEATSASFYSGIIPNLTLIGNLKNNSTGGNYGAGAKVDAMGSIIDSGHVASSIATLLGVPSPVTARPSLVAVSAGKIVSLCEPPKQV